MKTVGEGNEMRDEMTVRVEYKDVNINIKDFKSTLEARLRSDLGVKVEKEGIAKWGAPIEIISNIGVIDFENIDGKARLKSVHTGVTLDQLQENTGFDLIITEPLLG